VNGLVPWTPIHYFVFLGLAALVMRRRTRALGAAMIVLVVLDTWIVGAVYDWWGSIGFPGRRFDLIAVPSMIGLAAFGHEVRRWAARRRPGASLGLAAALLFLPLGIWNIALQIGLCRAMRTDIAQGSPAQWRENAGQLIDPMWTAFGNPLTWPASIPFAIEHGTHPRRWDVVGGQEIFYHDHQTLAYREAESTIVFADHDHWLYVDGPAAAREPETIGGSTGIRVSQGTSRIFLPLHFPDAGRIALTLNAPEGETVRVGLSINGVRLGTQAVGHGHIPVVAFAIPPGVTHDELNEAWVWVDGSYVLLVRAQLFDRSPPPRIHQEEANERLRQARRRAIGP
jgi:hypothetical protein